MPLQDFLDYVATQADEPLTWEIGGRAGTYKGKLVIEEKRSLDENLNLREPPRYEFSLVGDKIVKIDSTGAEKRTPIIVNLGSADVENPFSRTHIIKDNQIIYMMEQAA